ncbi:hypothetical protein GOQ27_07040 [Clostridium sp. D2Q-11]|uniref:Uncharacterized protein n=1 Tax=Anaeromonas frigoriresistens TaxID=2683708 RepID=A0A942UZ19_9FIRM|nr:hypothetical protein [Anaeromonas frigoriresistens]MBS4538212.1 hypothetical protein [Anaeromonas frigoriresistens]
MANGDKAKKSDKETIKVKEEDKVIVFKANKPLNKEEFELLSDIVKSEHKKSGVKIVLMPYSCEVGE